MTAPSPDREKVISRITKLLRLASVDSHTTEAEMMVAMTRAKELMARHHISMVEVDGRVSAADAAAIRIRVEQHTAYTRKMRSFAVYDYPVAWAVAHLTGTEPLLTRRTVGGAHYCSMAFLGEETDAHLASELYPILLGGVRNATRQACGSGWGSAHTSYALGFGSRLQQRAEAMATTLSPDEAQCVAMVLSSKREAINQYLRDHGVTRDARQSRTTIDPFRYSQGYRDGGDFNLSRGRRGLKNSRDKGQE
jgi:hypothetical protein